MLFLWAEENFSSPNDVNSILQQSIWYNSHIKTQGKWLFFPRLYNAGISRLYHLFDLDEGAFRSYNDFNIDYPNLIDFVSYYSIIASIPRSWKEILRINAPSEPTNALTWSQNFEMLATKGKLSRMIYMYLRDKIASDNTILLILWNNDLRADFTQKEFDNLFINIRQLVLSTKYRYFQYRILVRALTLNIHVSKWDRNVSDRCSFCNVNAETTLHLFVECIHVDKIWKALCKWFDYMYDIRILLTPSIILFNNYKGRNKELINLHILLLKFVIYRSKVQGIVPKFNIVIKEVNKVQLIEKYIADKNGKAIKHDIRWHIRD